MLRGVQEIQQLGQDLLLLLRLMHVQLRQSVVEFGTSLAQGVNDVLEIGDTSVLVLFCKECGDFLSRQRFDLGFIGDEDLPGSVMAEIEEKDGSAPLQRALSPPRRSTWRNRRWSAGVLNPASADT